MRGVGEPLGHREEQFARALDRRKRVEKCVLDAAGDLVESKRALELDELAVGGVVVGLTVGEDSLGRLEPGPELVALLLRGRGFAA